jgi:hypothetical protein
MTDYNILLIIIFVSLYYSRDKTEKRGAKLSARAFVKDTFYKMGLNNKFQLTRERKAVGNSKIGWESTKKFV